MTPYSDDPGWWKSATSYQIYPRSFCCSNGVGIGDFPGIMSKLDYLAGLGTGFIRLSPVFRLPMADNGYDIPDYQDIAPEFGTLADMDRLIAEAQARGIGIVIDLVALKRVFNIWPEAVGQDGWNSQFWGNHDLPCAVSKYGDGSTASARMLATVLPLMKGTPYVYQGEEIGMTNAAFTRIDQFRDVETLNFYKLQVAAGMDPAAFIKGANENGRDNARTPVQWTAGPQAGFSTGAPWIEVNPNHVTINAEINAEAAQAEPAGVFATCRRLAELRKTYPIIVQGSDMPLLADPPQIVAYLRALAGQRLAVIANFTGVAVTVDLAADLVLTGQSLIATHSARASVNGPLVLAPFEAFAILG